MTIFFEARHQAEEAGKEAQRIVVEKGLGFIASIIFLFRASSSAKKCAEDYVDAVLAGGSNIFCKCGYHPSRRRGKELLKETITGDLKKISRKFPTVGAGDETARSAKLLIQSLDVLRGRLRNPDFVRALYVDSNTAEVLPASVCDIVRRFCSGEINIGQADAQLILLKGDYQTLMKDMCIKPSEEEVVFMIRIF